MFKKFINSIRENASNAWIFTKVLVFIILELGIIAGVILLDLPSAIGILVSNILTFIIALAASKTFKTFSAKISKDEYELQRRERELANKVEVLEGENRILKEKVNTSSQIATHFNRINFGLKLELMDSTDIGYIVKEETFDSMKQDEALASHIPTPNFLERGMSFLNIASDQNSILFIEKLYHKSTIGIDLSKIRYATNGRDQIYLSGVELEILHNTSSDLVRDVNDVEQCLVFSKASDGSTTVKNDSKFTNLKNAYKKQQYDIAKSAHKDNNRALCQHFTNGLQTSLMKRYPNLTFISSKSNEYNRFSWRTLKEGNISNELMNVLVDMHMGIEFIMNSNSSENRLLKS
ncbi:MAG: hypothetical protein II985_00185 [Alistipes sp.]|nr:hypothetical protein [Alistipes sp.]